MRPQLARKAARHVAVDLRATHDSLMNSETPSRLEQTATMETNPGAQIDRRHATIRKRIAKWPLIIGLLLSSCVDTPPECFSKSCRSVEEAISQVDWIATRLAERHPDGIAPERLEDALGMPLPSALPAGGTLTSRTSNGAPGKSFQLVLPSGREVGFGYSNGEPDRPGFSLSLHFSAYPSAFCSWQTSHPKWACYNVRFLKWLD